MNTEELGLLLELPVRRMQTLVAWDPLFERLPFTECARRRCALLHEQGAALGADPITHLIVTAPDDTDLMAWARTRFGALQVSLASAETFDAWLAH